MNTKIPLPLLVMILALVCTFHMPSFAGACMDCPVNPGAIGSDQTVCSGVAPSLLTSVQDAFEPGATTGSIFYRWESTTDGGANWSTIPGANSSTYAPLIPKLETWYRRKAYVVDANINILCPGLYSNIVKITIRADALGGLVTADQTICTGTAPADLILTGNTGPVIKWQSSQDIAFSTYSDIPVSSTTLSGATIGNLVATTYYRAVIDNGTCPAVYSGSNDKVISEHFDTWVAPPANANYGGIPNMGNVTQGGGSIQVNGYGGYSLKQVPQGSMLEFTANFDGTTGSMFTNIGFSSTPDFNSPFAAIGRGFNPPDGHVYARVDVGGGPIDVDLGVLAGQFHSYRIVWGSTGFDFYVDGVLKTTIPGVINGTLYQNFFDYIADTHVLAIDDISVTHFGYAKVTVSPLTVGGIVNAAQDICTGTAPADMQLVAQVGSVLRWQVSTDAAFSAPVDLANTTTTLTSAQAGTIISDAWYRCVVKSGACPVNTSTPVHITVNVPTVGGTAGPDQGLCSGGTAANISLTGQTGQVLRWQSSTDASFTTPVDIANTTATLGSSFIGAPVSDVWYRAVVQNGACSSAFSSVVHISVGSLLPGTVSPDGHVCPGANAGSVNLSGNNGTVQKWQSSTDGGASWMDLASTSTTYSFTNLTQTTQFRAVVQGGACPVIQSSAATIFMNPLPLLMTADQTASGSPQTADLTAAAVTTGSDPGLSLSYWMDAGATNALATPAAAIPGVYYIKGLNATGCSVIKPVKVIAPVVLTLLVTDPLPVCAPATVDITAPSITAGSSPGLTFSYWQDAAATVVYPSPATATTGTYHIKGTDGFGRSAISAVHVKVNQPSSSTTTVSIAESQLPYAWNGSTFSAGGMHTVTLTNTAGCDSVANLMLTVLPSVTSSTTLTLCSSAMPYTWNSISCATPGTYNAKLTASDGRDSIATLLLTTVAPPDANILAPAPICEGKTADLMIELRGDPPFTITYDDGSGQQTETGIPGPMYKVTVSPPRTTTYRILRVEDSHCLNDAMSASAVVTVMPAETGQRLPTVNALADVPHHLLARNLGGDYQYEWSPGDGLSSTTLVDPVFKASSDHEYRIFMRRNTGCGTTDTLLVKVTDMNVPGHEPDILVPNAFTPNGDGRNDLLTPIPVNLDHLVYFRIFNRWGNIVFESTAFGSGWDGIFRGMPAPTESFIWIAEGVDRNGKHLHRKGTVTLIR